ncbi:coiled-coil-helix-coiled-coil-helix domain-containing protein 10, mitochondrial [Drosophila bipectinata]|uniref:coiled-coil-helix-coiled-coil-helix domain-containing protein 10, mitochondrial n=1 Tax=Drosophila bipectinata TaxID=42026 RepID=UPI001C89DBC8|nr:coiled-coil-helix-coiled-coil-helix domain-containing protein 10, mitochondrial [Drosophila bipectinata]
MPRRNKSTSAKAHSASHLPVAQPSNKDSVVRSTGGAFKDVAAHAAGVAAGSAVGHAVGAGIIGLFHGPKSQVKHSDLVQEGPCAFEMKQFLKCTEENADLNVCKEFNDAVRNCHHHYNL